MAGMETEKIHKGTILGGLKGVLMVLYEILPFYNLNFSGGGTDVPPGSVSTTRREARATRAESPEREK